MNSLVDKVLLSPIKKIATFMIQQNLFIFCDCIFWASHNLQNIIVSLSLTEAIFLGIWLVWGPLKIAKRRSTHSIGLFSDEEESTNSFKENDLETASGFKSEWSNGSMPDYLKSIS